MQLSSTTKECYRPPKEAHNHPIQANGFMNHVQINTCRHVASSSVHVSGHLTKYSWMVTLTGKQSPQVFCCIRETILHVWTPEKKLHSDNGGEFRNKILKNLCQTHKIQFVHGAPRNPSTQGQVERNYSTIKVNITNVLKGKGLQTSKWCEVVHEAA